MPSRRWAMEQESLKELERRGDLELEVGAGDAEKLLLAQNHGAYHALTWKGVAGA
mgnify:CR=1 FL=1